MSVMLCARTPMLNRKCFDQHLIPSDAHGRAFIPTQFRNAGKAGPLQQLTRGARGNYARRFIETTQCAQIEMIEVRMRKENQIDRRQLMKLERGRRQAFRTDGHARQTNSDPPKQDGIREYSDTEKINEQCGMP